MVIECLQMELTSWLVPAIWKEASKEKMSHKKDLQNFQNDWKSTPNHVISIHGNKDWIVPYGNSEFLKEQFPPNQFELITINDTSHDLIWSNFEFIKQTTFKSVRLISRLRSIRQRFVNSSDFLKENCIEN